MKKTFLLLTLLSFGAVCAAVGPQSASPHVVVSLSSETLPTQVVSPGQKDVEVLRLWFQPFVHTDEELVLNSLRVKYTGVDQDQILRYYLINEEKILSRVSLPDTDVISFAGLNVNLPSEKTLELRVVVDISPGEIVGSHRFSVVSSGDVIVREKEKTEGLPLKIMGEFPLTANKIEVGQSEEEPTECNLREEPVCGEDGLSYYNICIPYKKGIRIAHEGACTEEEQEKNLTVCPAVYSPVCGDDGKTYSNVCFLERVGERKAYDGACFPATFSPPVTATQAADLLQLKHNQLSALRPRLNDTSYNRLGATVHILKNYKFKTEQRYEVLDAVNNFLSFSQNKTDATVLSQAIEGLKVTASLARTESAKLKYKAGEIPFLDVDEGDWFLESVRELKSRDWISGYKDSSGQVTGLYRPAEPVTYAEATKLAFESARIDYTRATDTPLNKYAFNHWAYELISTAEQEKLSLWKDRPQPDKKTSRGQMMQLVLEAFGVNIPGAYWTPFTDMKKDSPYYDAVEYGRQIGLISGYPDGTFRPESSVSRAEVAKIIYKAAEVLGK